MSAPRFLPDEALLDASVGVCVRDAAHVVVFQNDGCRDACGDVQGRTCERTCVSAVFGAHETHGSRLGRGVTLHGQPCDVAVFVGQRDAATLLISRAPALARQHRFLSKRGLTARELEVASLVLLGWTNRAIASRLAIGHATVRTHLNRIHQKLPDGWLERAARRAAQRSGSHA